MVTCGYPTLNPTLAKGKAKDQTLTGIDSQTNTIVGDVNYITNKGSGGKDKLTGGDDASNFLFGDAQFDMHDSAKGGDDKLVGGSNTGDSEFVDQLYGDAFQMFEFTQGG